MPTNDDDLAEDTWGEGADDEPIPRTWVAILAGGAAAELTRRLNAFIGAIDDADGYVIPDRLRLTMADGPDGAWYAVLVPYHAEAEVGAPA